MSAFERLLEQKAVALQYSPEKDSAPVIVASGMGYMAEKITEAARKSGVPVYEDDSLATLLSRLQLGAAVPEESLSTFPAELQQLLQSYQLSIKVRDAMRQIIGGSHAREQSET